jgi:hypothetical protein
MRKLTLCAGLLGSLHWTTAHAYIGPGIGAGTLAVVLGILSSIFLAFVGILWYPIKRLLRRIRRKDSQR